MKTNTKFILGGLVIATGLYFLYKSKKPSKASFVNAGGNPVCEKNCTQEDSTRCKSGKIFSGDECKCYGCVPSDMVKNKKATEMVMANANGNFFDVQTTKW